MTLEKDALFKPRVDEAEVDVPSLGGTVRVRGLTRHEVMSAQKRVSDPLAIERVMLAMGMVDPQITEDEAGRWQKVAPAGELEPVTNKIQELSGIGEHAPKSGVQGDGRGPGPGDGVLPGGEAVPHGGGASGEPVQP